MPVPDTCDVPRGGRADTPGPVSVITPPTADSSRVKRGIKNQRKNHQERDQHGGGTRASRAGNYVLPNAISPGDTPETTPVSYSLRLGDPLGLKEVTTTRRLLDQLGLHADVAAAVTPTLAPAEAWTLAAYARGARLGPGWIATQVFDFARRQARPMRLAGRYDAVGRSLAVLDPAAAEAVLAVVDRCSPDDWEQLTVDALYAAAWPEVVAAVQEVWNVMCELRISGGHGVTRRERALPEQHPPVMSTAVAMTAQIWHAVLARLRQQLPPPVCATWLQPTALLALSDELAVVGAPNVFVRDELDQRYREAIVTALVDELGRQVSLEFVIEQSAAA